MQRANSSKSSSPPGQHARDTFEIDLHVIVREDIAETGDPPEPRREIPGQDTRLRKSIDRRPVVGDVETGRGNRMGGAVEGVPRA